jgi:periplasmic divalent cation tolerance protein
VFKWAEERVAMAERSLVEIVTTVETEGEAEDLARGILSEQLGACVGIERVRSLFRWRGCIEDEGEYRVSIKTVPGLASRVEAFVLKEHPYETPMVLRMAVDSSTKAYSRWVEDSVAPVPPDNPKENA